MKKLVAVLLAIIIIVGCSTLSTPLDEDYEFGDATESLLEKQVEYCTETNPVKRALLLMAIRSVVPTYPVGGACTKVASTISEKITEDIPESEAYQEYLKELEQARKDAGSF